MDIISALKETGKAVDERANGKNYVTTRKCGVLSWYDQKRDIFLCDVPLDVIIGDDWLPYYDKKEIRPEKAGELWAYSSTDLYANKWHHTKENSEGHIVVVGDNGICGQIEGMIHNQNGWKRIHPPVEDESVERIVYNSTQLDEAILQVGYPAILKALHGEDNG